MEPLTKYVEDRVSWLKCFSLRGRSIDLTLPTKKAVIGSNEHTLRLYIDFELVGHLTLDQINEQYMLCTELEIDDKLINSFNYSEIIVLCNSKEILDFENINYDKVYERFLGNQNEIVFKIINLKIINDLQYLGKIEPIEPIDNFDDDIPF